MKSLKLLLLIVLLLLTFIGHAQTPTTQGMEFWASFMRNGYRNGQDEHLSLIVSAKRDCVVTLSNSYMQWSYELTVNANTVVTYDVSSDLCYNEQNGAVANTGVFVSSTDTISLYIANEAQNSYDASNVLPLDALGCHYLLQTNQSVGEMSNHVGENRASFLILATEDMTTVNITPSVLTADGHYPGQPYELTLDRGQCYHVMTDKYGTDTDLEGDFSGTIVTSNENKPIAVFNGNCITSVPGGLNSGYDHVFEQAMPTDYWGKRFVVTATQAPSYMNLQEDLVKVTALEDNTTVTRDGETFLNLNAGESHDFYMDSKSAPVHLLEADRPIAVYLYQHSHGSGDPAYGDPSMVWISPVEQTVFEVTFSTFTASNLENHYVNIVCYTEHVPDMLLDDISIAAAFQPVPLAPELSYARYELNHAAHTLHCPGGFIAHVYGLGQHEGYAYSVGSSAKQLTKQLYVNDVLSSEYPNGYTTCQNETVEFRFESNYEFHHVDWDFGDGTTGQGDEVSHTYTSASDFPMQAVIYREQEGAVTAFDTVGIMVHAKPIYDNVPVEYTTCASTFSYLGTEYPVPGVHEVPLTSVYGCDSIVTLTLTQGEELWDFDTVTACESYHWREHDYYVSDTIEDRVYDVTPEGCDSIYVLYLTIVNPPDDTERTLSSCEPYEWHGMLCDHTGDYTMPFSAQGVCDYDSVLHFTLTEIPPVNESLSDCDPILWHGIEVAETGSYDYTALGPGGCDTLHHLDFVLESHPTAIVDTTVCDALEWHGLIYTESGDYSVVIPMDEGCDSIVTLSLMVNQPLPLGEIVGTQWIAIANSFWPGIYHYYIDSTGMDSESIHWELLDNTSWRLEAHGASCTLTATNSGQAQLRVWYDTDDGCQSESVLLIQSSGFGIEEDVTTPVELYPNPTDGMLFVKGEELVGMVVYDLMGQQLMEVSSLDGSHIEADVHTLKPALYLVKIQTKKGNKLLLFSVL